MEEKKDTTAYRDILNDIIELKELVLKIYTVAAFYGDDESAQKGYEVADDFSKKVGDLEKNFLEKASFIGNQISYGGVRIDIWTHLMRGCIIELCTLH